MNEILVIGHKNPDADSVCSAYCYAYLKNKLDKSNNYIPARCGTLNKQTKYIFDRFNIIPPAFFSDVYPRVNDVMTKDVFYVRENDPFWLVLKSINNMKIRLIPVVDAENKLKGVISVPEIASFFARLDTDFKPKYLLRAENFSKVIPGYFLNNAAEEEFNAFFLVGAMPLDKFKEKLDDFDPKEIVLIAGNREDILNYAKQKGVLAIVLTGVDNSNSVKIEGFDGWVYVSTKDTAETLRLLALSIPAKYVMDSSPTAKDGDYLRDISSILKSDYHRGLPVIDEGSRLRGIVTRSDLIKRHKRNIILIDHNELAQAIDGVEETNIIEIVDHHRLGSIRSNYPINVYAKPVGSSCTLVYQLFKFNNIEIDSNIASVLLAGLLSDTVILESPTTTNEDREAADELSRISSLDIKKFGNDIFSVTQKLSERTINEIIESDFKVYKEFDVYFGIGQVEVTNLEEVNQLEDKLIEGLLDKQIKNSLNWVMLMVTDILNHNSLLISVSSQNLENKLGFNKISKHTFHLPNIISRKKQLLPEILRALEE